MTKVFTWARPTADLAERQSNCQWYRSWRDAGFDPCILTPESCGEKALNLTRVLKASQQPEHVWGRWNVRLYGTGLGYDDTLLVAPTVLPMIRADQITSQRTTGPAFIRYDTQGRVIYSRKSPFNAMASLLKHDFSEFAGQPFTDWDLLLLDYPESPTIDRAAPAGMAIKTGDWFKDYTQEQILELRAKRMAT